MAAATVGLGIQTWRSVRKAGEAVHEAARLAAASERQIPLFENELRLVERQVAAMERQLALQESSADAARRRSFPVLEVEATELSEQSVKGNVYYRGGEDPAEDIEVWMWFRGGRYRANVGSILPTPGSVGFTATRVTDPDPAGVRIPGWALTRGYRVDAVSWKSGIRGEWWAQRLDEQGRNRGLPDRGEWWVDGAQRPTSVG